MTKTEPPYTSYIDVYTCTENCLLYLGINIYYAGVNNMYTPAFNLNDMIVFAFNAPAQTGASEEGLPFIRSCGSTVYAKAGQVLSVRDCASNADGEVIYDYRIYRIE